MAIGKQRRLDKGQHDQKKMDGQPILYVLQSRRNN
jgi:hypothetical protein